MLKSLGLGAAVRARNDTTFVAAGVAIEGNVRFRGVLEVEGQVQGEIRANADEHAVVRILPGGHVCGDVHAPVIVVNGKVTGNVHSSEHVELAAHAEVTGDVEYSLIEMSKGAQVNGRLIYRGDARAAVLPPAERDAASRPNS